jgi:hypothetical protein
MSDLVNKLNKPKTKTIATATITLTITLLTLTTLAALSASQTVPITGTIATVNVEAYSDAACTQPVTTLNIGTVSPGSTATQTIYVKNTGNIPLTLTMATSDWNPTGADSYLSLSWNRQNTILAAGQSIQATLTLTVAADTGSITTFSVSATITGTQ